MPVFYQVSESWLMYLLFRELIFFPKKGKIKVQEVSISQTVAHFRIHEEEETDKTKPNKRKSNKRTKSAKISPRFLNRDNRILKELKKKTQKQTNTRQDLKQIAL